MGQRDAPVRVVRAFVGDSCSFLSPIMAEICCEEAKSTPATAVAAVAAAAAAVAVASSALERRRRRLEMRRFQAPVADDVRAGKRQRLARTASGSCPDVVSDFDRQEPPERLPRYGVTSVCGRRREMEDAVSIRPDFLPGATKHHFFGVFDGHGCSHVRPRTLHRFPFLCRVLYADRSFAATGVGCNAVPRSDA